MTLRLISIKTTSLSMVFGVSWIPSSAPGSFGAPLALRISTALSLTPPYGASGVNKTGTPVGCLSAKRNKVRGSSMRNSVMHRLKFKKDAVKFWFKIFDLHIILVGLDFLEFIIWDLSHSKINQTVLEDVLGGIEWLLSEQTHKCNFEKLIIKFKFYSLFKPNKFIPIFL